MVGPRHLSVESGRMPDPAFYDGQRPDRASILRWDGRVAAPAHDHLAPEEPLEVRVRGRAAAVTMRTPGHDEELAAGFLLGEGVVRGPGDVVRVVPCPRNEAGNVVKVTLAPHVDFDAAALSRHVLTSASCGLCGKASIEAVMRRMTPVESDLHVSAETLVGLPALMRMHQASFDLTGGLHAAALFEEGGRLVVAREDIGRHNAVDKVLGFALLAGLLPLRRAVMVVSGRVSFEIVQKAAAAGVPILAAVSAPSSLAVDFARQTNQTLVGFLRGRRMNVYSHARRIGFSGRSPVRRSA